MKSNISYVIGVRSEHQGLAWITYSCTMTEHGHIGQDASLEKVSTYVMHARRTRTITRTFNQTE